MLRGSPSNTFPTGVSVQLRERERKAVLNPTKGYQSQIWNDLGRNGWIHERIEASPHVCVDVPQANVFTNKWNGTVWH